MENVWRWSSSCVQGVGVRTGIHVYFNLGLFEISPSDTNSRFLDYRGGKHDIYGGDGSMSIYSSSGCIKYFRSWNRLAYQRLMQKVNNGTRDDYILIDCERSDRILSNITSTNLWFYYIIEVLVLVYLEKYSFRIGINVTSLLCIKGDLATHCVEFLKRSVKALYLRFSCNIRLFLWKTEKTFN